MKALGTGKMRDPLEDVVFNMPAEMSRLSESFAGKRQIRGDDPAFAVRIFGSFRIVFDQMSDLYRITGELSAGYFYAPTTEPLIVEPTFGLYLRFGLVLKGKLRILQDGAEIGI